MMTLRRFASDRRGVSAVEFALLAPVMIGLLFAIGEFCQGYMARKRVGHATAQIADITAQSGAVTKDQLDDTFAIGALILSPFPAAELKMRVTGVTRNAAGVAKVDWSRGSGLTAFSTGATVTVPAGMIANGESVIMSEATYNYYSPIRYLLPNATLFQHKFFLRPRLVDKIACSDC